MADISIPTNEWVSANTLGDITVGNAFYIMNKSNSDILLIRSDDQPDDDSDEGALITPKNENYAFWTIENGDSEVWLKAKHYTATVYVYE